MADTLLIETSRLLLRVTEPSDIDLYVKLLTNPDVVRFLPTGKPFSHEYICSYLEQKLAHWEKGFGTFTVALRDQPHIAIGYAGVEQLPDSPYHDIRYGLLPEFQGFGYALEAAKAAMTFALDNHDLDEVFGVAVKANLASLRILKKLRMSPSSQTLYDSDDLVTLSLKKSL